MSSIRFQVGHTGKTRFGHDYEVIAIRPQRELPVVAEVNGEVETFTAEGEYYGPHHLHPYDLQPPRRKLDVWLNVYEDEDVIAYDSEVEAFQVAMASGEQPLVVGHKVTIELP